MNNNISKPPSDFNNTAITLFTILNIGFSAFLLLNSLYSGILLLSLSLIILFFYFYNLIKKTIKIINYRVDPNKLLLILEHIPANIAIKDSNDNVIFSNIKSSSIRVDDYQILQTINIDNYSNINKIKVNNKIHSIICYKNSIDDVNHNPKIYIHIEYDISHILKDNCDISELNNKEKYILSAFENSSDGILIFTYNNSQPKEYIYSNATLNNMILPNTISNNILEVFHKSEQERVKYIFANLTNQSILFESLILNDTSYFPAEIHTNIIKINNTNIIVLNIRDITFRKEIESERNKKRVLSTENHNNLSIINILHLTLTKIYKYIQSSKESCMNIKSLHYDLKDEAISIINSQEQILLTIRELIAFYTPPNIKSLINIKTFIENIISVIYIKEVINNNTITIIQKGDIQDIYIDESSLKFVLIAIINNAIENINITKGTNFYGNIIINIENLNEDFIKISIEDNSGGVEENKLNRIFDAFYTTRESKMGLGLTRAKIVIEDILFGSIKASNTKDGLKIDMIISIK